MIETQIETEVQTETTVAYLWCPTCKSMRPFQVLRGAKPKCIHCLDQEVSKVL